MDNVLSADNRITVFEHVPYLPDLAPCDFYLFRKVKNASKGTILARRRSKYINGRHTDKGHTMISALDN